MAGETRLDAGRRAAEGDRAVPGLPSEESRGRPIRPAARRAELRVSDRRHAQLRERPAHRQRGHAEGDESAVGERSRGDRALYRRAVTHLLWAQNALRSDTAPSSKGERELLEKEGAQKGLGQHSGLLRPPAICGYLFKDLVQSELGTIREPGTSIEGETCVAFRPSSPRSSLAPPLPHFLTRPRWRRM